MLMVASVELEYRSAFEEFSRKAQRVQFLTENPSGDRQAFETALLELEKGYLAYIQARDAFMRSMLPGPPEAPPDFKFDYSGDVKTIAELLWEGAGRPAGTAEEDWERAESIVQCAVAASPDC
jgi:hypothetical protein